MSADIVGSTTLYEAFGDTRARAIVTACLDVVRVYCANHFGHVIAEIGDQIIAHFDTAIAAAAAASEIHICLQEKGSAGDGPHPRMRVGLHYGVVPAGGDLLLSETVKLANWACNNAKPEQTVATRALIEQLPRIFRAVSRYVDDETWNLVSLEHMQLYEIIWDVEGITAYAGEKTNREGSYDAVSFAHHGVSITVDVNRPVISIGRADDNDLVIKSDLVSRQHLSAQFSRGRCTITDNSTNGSIVVMSDGTRHEIRRESLRLHDNGIVIPGNPAADETTTAISFRCF